MPEVDSPKAIAKELALLCSAWKSRVWFYVSEKHTLDQIEKPGYFEKCEPNILPGNFIFINDKDGKAAMRVFAKTVPPEEFDDEEIKRFKAQYYLVKPS